MQHYFLQHLHYIRLLSPLNLASFNPKFVPFQDGNLPGPSESGPADSFLMMTMIWAILAIALYLFRPSSLRNQGDQKPSQPPGGNGNGGGNDPEPPAVM